MSQNRFAQASTAYEEAIAVRRHLVEQDRAELAKDRVL